jgi:cytochrome b561
MLHKSIGLAVLALAAMRLVLRNTSRLPPEEGGIAWIEAAGARTVHVLLYVILFAMPLSGYLSESARGHAVSVFGLFDILPLSPVSPALRSVAWTIHNTGQFAVYAVVGLHVSAALFHLVVRRDGVMARMLPEFSQHRRVVSVHHAAE